MINYQDLTSDEANSIERCGTVRGDIDGFCCRNVLISSSFEATTSGWHIGGRTCEATTGWRKRRLLIREKEEEENMFNIKKGTIDSFVWVDVW